VAVDTTPASSRMVRWRSPPAGRVRPCPRVGEAQEAKRSLREGLDGPEVLRPCIAENCLTRAIRRGWEGLLRLRLGGRGESMCVPARPDVCSAGFVSAAAATPVSRIRDGLGSSPHPLSRDYFVNPVCRTEILDLLNRRGRPQPTTAVTTGSSGKHGRTMEDSSAAISEP